MATSINSRIFLFTISLLLLTKIIDSNSIKYWNDEPKILNRHKREDIQAPEIIKIRVQDGYESEIFEVSKLEPNHVANENLKIWTVHAKGIESDKSIMQTNTKDMSKIGPWFMYQNNVTKSAVVFFPTHNLLSGVVGKKYSISYISYSGSENVNVTIAQNDDHRKKRETEDIFQQLVDDFPGTKKFRRSAEIKTKRLVKPQFYLESMVFISGNAIDSLPWSIINLRDKKCEHYIMHVLSFFNIIDMIFSKTKFKINIAGIVIRQDGDNFPFFENGAFDRELKKFKLHNANDALLNFMSRRKTDFGRDSFDYAILLTDYFIYNDKTNETVDSFSSYPKQGINQAKQSNSDYPHPLIFSQSNLTFASTKSVAHQIYHLIGGANYIKTVNSSDSDTSVIIEDFDKKCPKCFKWNEDYCNFVNKPTSLGSMPRKLVSKDDQCWCHNYDYYFENNTNETIIDICHNGFECQFENSAVMNVTLVMDGTPCDENKVCWNGECM